MLALECLEDDGSESPLAHLTLNLTRTHFSCCCFSLFFSFLMVISFFLSALLCSAVYCYFCPDFVQLLFFSEDGVAVCCFCRPFTSLSPSLTLLTLSLTVLFVHPPPLVPSSPGPSDPYLEQINHRLHNGR